MAVHLEQLEKIGEMRLVIARDENEGATDLAADLLQQLAGVADDRRFRVRLEHQAGGGMIGHGRSGGSLLAARKKGANTDSPRKR